MWGISTPLASFALAISLSAPAFADPSVAALAIAFGARPAVSQISLAPDGTRIAFVAPLAGQGGALYVVRVTDGAEPKRVAVATGDPERLDHCRWANSASLVCLIYGQISHAHPSFPNGRVGEPFEMLTVVPADAAAGGTPPKQVPLGPGLVVDWLGASDNAVLTQVYTGTYQGYYRAALLRYDLGSGKAKETVAQSYTMQDFITDGLGTPRLVASAFLGGDDPTLVAYRYRPIASQAWKPLSTYSSSTGQGFFPRAVDPKTDLA